MKRFFKSFLVVLIAVCVAFPLVACKKKVSPTTTNVDKVKIVNGVSTNGGLTVVHGEYLYFINGEKTNDGKMRLIVPCLVCATPHSYIISNTMYRICFIFQTIFKPN